MKTSLGPEKLKGILIMVAVLVALALPLMLVLEDFVRDALIVPLSYYAWYFGVIFDALPQSLLIALVSVALLYLGAISLKGKQTTPVKPLHEEPEAPGNVKVWVQRINMVSQGSYSRERFESHFGRLVMRLISHEERMPLRETVRGIQAGEIEVAHELEPYVLGALRSGSSNARGLLAWVMGLLRRKPSHEATLRQLAAEIDPALHAVELRLRLIQREELDE